MSSYPEHKGVQLTEKAFDNFLTDVEKVAVVALALGTTNARAIMDVTKIKKRKVKWLLTSLYNNDWDIEATLADQCSDRTDNFSINKETYPVLAMKGLFA